MNGEPMRVLVVVPAFNEAKSLAPLLDELRAVAVASPELGSRPRDATFEVVVIDDASHDQTARVAREGGARVVQLCRNLGIGGAVQTGLRLAHREAFDCAVQMDGDGQHPPAELAKLVQAFVSDGRPDIVVGSRYLDRQGFQSTWLRRVGILWLRLVVGVVTRRPSTDPTSGYRLYGPRALRLFSASYPHDYPEPEALVLAKAAGLKVTEVPVRMRERLAGNSSIKSLQAPYYLLKVTLAVLLAFARSIGSDSRYLRD